MLLAWMTLCPVGMMVARYLRRSSQVQMFGKDLWFVIHVSVMSFTVATTIIAFILAFSYLGGWEYVSGVLPPAGSDPLDQNRCSDYQCYLVRFSYDSTDR
ncbi:putative ferric-chelate reductase 1 [Poecilia latipinna]|uniref:putative ferric-chelate reductase 1 n=1 Tax=Poecilia latipinna TaxID=48699 RepID=UPI00072DC408|nr:PREDICTED: putative ferric-chelate reductase 1 [Poecilia latipinna]XP_014883005.1 PREDICTED: putative ferric-chelate reductase 1 [Poecilia latipinna]